MDSKQGNTLPMQGDNEERQRRVPRTPNERDESADSQATREPSARRIGGLAHDDLAGGRVDTDRGPVMDAAYDKVREGAAQPDKKFRP
jgi:hypothetical protein